MSARAHPGGRRRSVCLAGRHCWLAGAWRACHLWQQEQNHLPTVTLTWHPCPPQKTMPPPACCSAFRDEFLLDLGPGLIEEVVVGCGPCGELRYPAYPEANGWRFPVGGWLGGWVDGRFWWAGLAKEVAQHVLPWRR